MPRDSLMNPSEPEARGPKEKREAIGLPLVVSSVLFAYFFIPLSHTSWVQAPTGFLVMTGSELPFRSTSTVR